MAEHHTAYQHRPLSNILAPEVGQQSDSSQTPQRDDKGRFVAEQTPTEDDLPEKYRGKTAKEIADMHINAEKRLGQIQNELGSMRGLVSDLAQVKRTVEPETQAEEKIDVSGDDLISDPVGTIRKVVQHDLNEVKAEREQERQSARLEEETNRLLRDFGDLEAVTASADFQEFAARTPSRLQDLELAAGGEGFEQIAAARRLLENYQDFQHTIKPESQTHRPSPVEQARKVATESSRPSGNLVGKDVLHESDVIALLRSDPAKYRSPSFQKELMDAIREGRFVKN